MSGVNKAIILGRLGQDPEVRTTPSGQQVCTMSIATSEKYTKDGKQEEKTEWHRVVCWGKTAELAGKYLKKGRNVYIEGKIQTRSWDDQAGQKRYTTEVIANQLTFVDSGGGQGGGDHGHHEAPAAQGGGGHAPSQQHMMAPHMDDDVPF